MPRAITAPYCLPRPFIFIPRLSVRVGNMRVIPIGDVYTGRITTSVFEGYGRTEFLLAPAGAPDPRAGLLGERCGSLRGCVLA
jgi:hypothetical protein